MHFPSLARSVLLTLATLWLETAASRTSLEPSIKCSSETGPSAEWAVKHRLTPGDLQNLRVEAVKADVGTESDPIHMNISWKLREDASIRVLTATKICVLGKGRIQTFECVRCNYTDTFKSQTNPSGDKWQFHYVGFPVELNTLYFINAHNIPTANMNEDAPSISVNYTSPGCLDGVMKFKKRCVEVGSLWDPKLIACKKEKSLEVTFTTSTLGTKYSILVEMDDPIGVIKNFERNQTRVSVTIAVPEESEGVTVQLIPYFPKCGNDCIRRKGTILTCSEPDRLLRNLNRSTPQDLSSTGKREIMEERSNKTISVGSHLLLILPASFVVTWVLAAGVYLIWRHEKVKQVVFQATKLQPPIKVLVVYPSDVCFHHTVCCFAEFLHDHCRSDIIIDKWQKRKIAEMGPVQWLATQKEEADKVIFLRSSWNITMCEVTCHKDTGGQSESSQELFMLAFNLFCSDLKSQSLLHKYMVVYFNEENSSDNFSALNLCPKYHLMKDTDLFCRDLQNI
ncbi:interleukin-17 receptor B isoform X2 [Ornithorhynchus anatinus]|uniref:interleukin-17 receptor B isoform X2 n=1 Tax=Ornithorhynchus anatinus TaxID=9258 RepID=UPI0010A8D219|nr:interleukin-17 receptor B isoform X2 [Ornithorhynchus anatinus]